MKPRLLDLFCGAGGAAMGYHRAGFEVVGVDIKPQPRYPFEFHWGDAMEWLSTRKGQVHFQAVHASPPCQRYSAMTKRNGTQHLHPDLVADVRRWLVAWGLPYVIENVEGSPLLDPVRLCASTLCPIMGEGGLKVGLRRHRLFESNLPLVGAKCDHSAIDKVLGVYGGGTRQATRTRAEVGGGNTQKATAAQARVLMEMPWATRDEMNQAVPPAYTEWVGRQLMRTIVREGVILTA